MDNTKEILKNQLKKLPKDIQDAILSVDLRSKMQFITKKNNLHIDQAEALENEAVFVLLGIEHPSGLVSNIAKHVEVSEEKAEAIAEDLNREIFLKVRESLKKIFEGREGEGEESSLLAGEEKGSLLAGSFLGRKEKDGESFLGKTEEEELNRENILREIEDKGHHNLPMINKSELHLEAKPPSEIVPSGQAVFQNNEVPNEIKKEKPAEIITPQKQPPKQLFIAQEGALRTMPKDIVKAKMGGTVSVPKETIEIGGVMPPPKVKLPDAGKTDPYRERTT